MKIVRAAKDNINRIVKVFKLVRSSGSSGTGLPVGGTDGQFLQKSGTANFIAQWFTLTKAYLGLGNVTDDAQLKRSAGDFQAFTQKITPAAGDSVLIEDGSDGNNKKRALIDSFLGGGGGGGINYDSPIAVNTSQTITPNDGDYFTSTSKLVTLTGTAGEVFEPAESGETSRIIWGRGAGAAITLTVNTSSLGIGDTFAIELDNGESRIIMLNSAGDLVKIDGVEIPMEFYAYADSPQDNIPSGVYTTCQLDVAPQDIGDTFNTGTFKQTIKRAAAWNYTGFCGIRPTTTNTLDRALVRLGVNTVNNKIFMDAFPVPATVGTNTFIVGSSGAKVDLVAGDDVTLIAIAVMSSSTWRINGQNDIDSLVALSGLEVIPW